MVKIKTVDRAESLIKNLVECNESEELKRRLMKRWAKDFYKEYIKEAREAAESEFSDWLRERHEISQHASKREELMKACTHPEARRIYCFDEDNYPDDMVWHCTACGYAEIREDKND